MGSVSRLIGPFDVKRIAIIGAGPTGLAAAKFLLAEKAFDKIEIFEQQSEVGGVWNYSTLVGRVSVPQTTPHGPPEAPIWSENASAPVFPNPMYSILNTNIPKSLMQFSDLDFSSGSLLFPTREDVQSYLIKYSQDVRHLISFTTQVEDLRLVTEGSHEHWKLFARSTITRETKETDHDAIIVANGHYSVPYIPSVPGMEPFNAAHPHIITHSKTYRSPDSFLSKKVIVVGCAASGLDIGTQISKVCKKPLLNSVRNSSPFKFETQNKEEVPPIAEFIVEDRAVRFEDGRVENDIDAIVYCTGYLYSYPFLESIHPPVVTNGGRVLGLYQQIFNIIHPTLTFTALAQKVIPFPVSEAQAAAIAKVWSNKLELPSKERMMMQEQKQVTEQGDGTSFHVLGYPKDAKYLNGLHDWVKSANDGFGKEPAFWGPKQLKEREVYAELRKRFVETGGHAKTIEELGFEIEHGDE